MERRIEINFSLVLVLSVMMHLFLVIAVIANGLPLITQQSGIQFVVTGLVLLVAASVDAISRRRAAATGR